MEDDEPDLSNPPFPLTAIDRELLVTKDEDFHRITWCDLKRIISENALEDLKRLPSDLHRYLRWSHRTKAAYGSITNYVVRERLFWIPAHPVTPGNPVSATSFSHHSATPFEDWRDYAVLLNDWPYGFADGISHVLVWSRTPILVDEAKGDVTPESRARIDAFVHDVFVRRLAQEECSEEVQAKARVLWFKNWVSLQSVRGVDHVHVLVKDAPSELLRAWVQRRDLDAGGDQ